MIGQIAGRAVHFESSKVPPFDVRIGKHFLKGKKS